MDDHDLLIELKTKMDMMIDNQNRQFMLSQELTGRVAALEAKDRGDSERIGSVVEAVKSTSHNSDRINIAQNEISSLRTRMESTEESLNKRMDGIAAELSSYRSKGNLMDAVNAAGAILAGMFGGFFTK